MVAGDYTMRNAELRLLILTISFLCLPVTSVSKAQSGSNSSSLEGTKWTGETTTTLPNGLQSVTQYDYAFLGRKAVRVHFISQVAGWAWVNEYNMSLGKYENVYKFVVQSTDAGNESGTYKQSGNSIHIEFPNSHQIDAQINGNRMIGKLVTRTSVKAIWSAEKVSSNTEAKGKDTPKNIYGPWETVHHLHDEILNYFVDTKAATSGLTDETKIQEFKKLYKEVVVFHESEFKEVSLIIARKLNRYFGSEVFKPEDFLPPKDPRSDKDRSGGLSNDLSDPYIWTISGYIRKIYVPVVQRAFSVSRP